MNRIFDKELKLSVRTPNAHFHLHGTLLKDALQKEAQKRIDASVPDCAGCKYRSIKIEQVETSFDGDMQTDYSITCTKFRGSRYSSSASCPDGVCLYDSYGNATRKVSFNKAILDEMPGTGDDKVLRILDEIRQVKAKALESRDKPKTIDSDCW